MLDIRGVSHRWHMLSYSQYVKLTHYPLETPFDPFANRTDLDQEAPVRFQLLITTKMLKNIDFFCFQTLRCCIYHANKC